MNCHDCHAILQVNQNTYILQIKEPFRRQVYCIHQKCENIKYESFRNQLWRVYLGHSFKTPGWQTQCCAVCEGKKFRSCGRQNFC